MIIIFVITFVMAFLISLVLFNGIKLKGMVAIQKHLSNSKKQKFMKALGFIVFIIIILGLYRIIGLNFYSGVIAGVIGAVLSSIFKKDAKVENSI